ncbi:hypothetical protein E5288_WYG010658 [Bos mutus]|uniref:Interleukin-7 n=1 Tax=Bos mutus TaxID=72004 RepID=A0A6B0RT73_9CETA|nr:hypothetical protein [Bos mutus]
MTTPAPADHVPWYIFGIPPLILVLLPVASSDCDISGKDGGAYQNVLMVNIDDLDNMINFDSNCLNNEPNFFKKHSCDDNKEASFLNRASRKLRQFLKMNISDDFKLHLSTVSQGTLTLLNCTSKGKGRKPPSLSEAQPTKNLLDLSYFNGHCLSDMYVDALNQHFLKTVTRNPL